MIIGIAGPYVVHLGTVDVRYPYGIMAIISLCGAVAVSPETLIVVASFTGSSINDITVVGEGAKIL
jgi:hypothetical protein